MVYETVCPKAANYYSFPKRRKKRTVSLVRNLIRAKQNLWKRKKQFVRNILGLNRRRVYASRRPYQSANSRPVYKQGQYSTLTQPQLFPPPPPILKNVTPLTSNAIHKSALK